MVSSDRCAGYALLAAAVVAQAVRDADVPDYRSEVLLCCRTGALAWWMALAGVRDEKMQGALEAIVARTRPGGRPLRPTSRGRRPPSLWHR